MNTVESEPIQAVVGRRQVKGLDAPKLCPKCGAASSRREFFANRATADGFHDWCRACDAERARKTWGPSQDAPESKVCRLCGAERPIAAFPRNLSARDGHRRECKPCLAARKARVHAQDAPGSTDALGVVRSHVPA